MTECNKVDFTIKNIKYKISQKRQLIVYSRRNYIEREGIKEEVKKLEEEVSDLKKELIKLRYEKFKCVLGR